MYKAYRNNKFENNPHLSEATKKKIRFRQYQARESEKAFAYLVAYPIYGLIGLIFLFFLAQSPQFFKIATVFIIILFGWFCYKKYLGKKNG